MFENLVAQAKMKAKQIYEHPVPLGKTILVTGGLILLTAVVSRKPMTVVVNRYSTGGLF